jgi:DNA repair exonuclease SbcCD ATPase subunit
MGEQTSITNYNEWLEKERAKLAKRLEDAMYNLSHMTIELRKEGSNEIIRKTEIDLISGDITVWLSGNPTEEQINQANEKAIQMAREELDKRCERLQTVIQTCITAIAPGGSLAKAIEALTKQQTKT